MSGGAMRVVVADDQAMVRGALGALLSLEDDVEVVGQAADCGEVVALATSLRPDVVLMDVQMPAGAGASDGIAAVALVLERSPATRVIVVTTFGRAGYLQRALAAGARGFMVKDAPAERLLDAMREVRDGRVVVDPDLAVQSLALGPSPLTAKEAEVLAAVARGGDSAAVAARVHLSAGTVRNHLSSAIGKLDAANRAEAVRIATEHGWI